MSEAKAEKDARQMSGLASQARVAARRHKHNQSHPDKPTHSVCCYCGFSGDEEGVCVARPDEIHCVHWFEGPDGDNPQKSAG